MGKKKKLARAKQNYFANCETENVGKSNEDSQQFKHSTQKILEKAEEFIDSFEFEMAHKFCMRALEQEPENIECLETTGNVCLELGKFDEAQNHFLQAIKLEPDTGHGKYMYMGQLENAKNAIKYFEKGIEIMKCVLNNQNSQATSHPEVSPRDISNAYCSIAEIYLTDCCEDEFADVRCKEALQQSIASDDSNPEAYQSMASYLLSKDEMENAKEMIEKSVSFWLPQWIEKVKDDSMADDSVSFCALSIPVRMNAAKILIEVECYNDASEILELLLDEDDEIVEIWYMLGWLHFLQGEDYYYNSKHYLDRACEVINITQYDDVEVTAHIKELLEKIGTYNLDKNEDNFDNAVSDDQLDSDEECVDDAMETADIT